MKRFLITLLLVICPALTSHATTWYARTDGGTATQCTGTTDAAYDGAGTGEACAFNHPAWALGGSGTTGPMAGGDTLIINGTFSVGIGMPNTAGCVFSNQQNCVLDIPPSGTVTAPTKILGSNWNTGCATKAVLWGTGSVQRVLDFTGTSNVELQCVEITDHSTCGFRVGSQCTEVSGATTSLVGTYGRAGIHGINVTNFKAWNVDVHGMSKEGVTLSDLNGTTDLNNFNVDGNYFAGWDGDGRQYGGTGSLNNGVFRARNIRVRFNGCQEAYPRSGSFTPSDYSNCVDQNSNPPGYGDGFGSYNTGGDWFFYSPDISWNGSDGLDLLYGNNNLNLYIDKGKFLGNDGNAIKFTAKNVKITNTVVIANCTYHALAGKVLSPALWTSCRAGGVPFSAHAVAGSNWEFINDTIYTATDSDTSAIIEVGNRNLSCNGTESYLFKNLIVYSHINFGWGAGFYNDSLPTGACSTAWDNRTVTYSKIYNFPNNQAGTGNTYTAPAWAGTVTVSTADNLSAVQLSSNVGGGNASTYWNTSNDAYNFPQNASIDQGAFQYGSSIQLAQAGQACAADTDCAAGTCTNFACSGSCTSNGGACVTGATCCSSYCNGSSVCAVATTCGDGVVQPTETCDTAATINSNCILQGFTGGTLSCSTNCLSYDTSACTSTTTFPLAPVLDNFNRANGAVGSNWTTLDLGMEVSSNQAVMASGVGNWYSQWAGSTFGADVESYVKIVTKPADGSSMDLKVRHDAINDNSYFVLFNPLAGTDTLSLYRQVADVDTQLGSTVNQEVSNGDSIGISAVGSAIKVYYKSGAGAWSQIISQTDTNVTAAGRNSIFTSSSATVLDDFGGGSINPVVCGNGLKEGAEVCDGADLGGQSCTTLGYASGTLACSTNCSSFNTTSCSSASCGNNILEIGETCDGTDLGGATCASIGLAAGTLACNGGCSAFVTTGCSSASRGSATGRGSASGRGTRP